jgi:predicted DNA-binding transcriptional regulator YafY
MPIIKYVERVQRMDQLIRRKSTGTPKELAAKLELSERSLYELINQMKDLGAPIIFSKSRNSYVYTSQGKFDFGFREVV